MNRYIPTSGQDTCEKLTSALWGLARPAHLRSEEDTQAMFGSITCIDGSVWLVADTAYTIPVHKEAELDGIAGVLQPWMDAGYLPKDTNEKLAELILSLRGQQLTVWDAFPDLFKKQAMTREELVKLGLLVDLSPLPSA